MRTLLAPLLLLLALPTPLAHALPPSVQKRVDHRGETAVLVEQVLKGSLSVPNAVSRLRLLREEPYAAGLLTRALPEVLEPRRLRDVTAVLAGLETRSAEPSLLGLAGHGDSAVRMYAAQGLGRLHSPHTEVLLPLLEDKSFGVRREAAKALGATHDPKVGKVLLDTARTEGDPQTRVLMLEAVGGSGDKKQVPALKAFLEDSSEGTRFSAARGLCLLGAPEGFAYARQLLASEDRFVRLQGLSLYEGLPQKVTSPVLRPLLYDKDLPLAAAAARILYQGGDKTMMSWLVLASWHSQGQEKLVYEKELETLHLADDERKVLLRKAGVVK